jgi:acyl carrier protein
LDKTASFSGDAAPRRSTSSLEVPVGLDSVELVMKVEEHFDISIPDADASTLVTVGMLHQWVEGELRRLDRPNVDSATVFCELRDLICGQLRVKAEQVVPEARFVQDLHMD